MMIYNFLTFRAETRRLMRLAARMLADQAEAASSVSCSGQVGNVLAGEWVGELGQ